MPSLFAIGLSWKLADLIGGGRIAPRPATHDQILCLPLDDYRLEPPTIETTAPSTEHTIAALRTDR